MKLLTIILCQQRYPCVHLSKLQSICTKIKHESPKQSVTIQTKTPQNETKLLRMLKIWEQASYMIQKNVYYHIYERILLSVDKQVYHVILKKQHIFIYIVYLRFG